MRPSRAFLISWTAALALSVFPAFAQDVQHGRVSYVDNDGLIKGTEDAEWSIAQLNSLVMPGDSIWADEDGVLEVEVSGGSFVRLADGSKIDVGSMPPDARVQASTGSFYVHRLRQSEGDFTLETPVGDVQVGLDSQVRVDVLEEGAATVTVRWGNAVIHSGGTATRVVSGNRVYIDPGYLPSEPEAIDRGREDAFDTWNRERSRKIARGASRNTIGQAGAYSTPIGAYDLDDYGEWIVEDNTSYWRPTVVREYVPYRVGRWSYVPRHGHVWVGHHPFTYITSHHGYWHHHHRHGWIWSYHPVYSPAYVASVRYGDNFIWAPLGIHGNAVHVSGSYFTAGGFHFSIGYSTYTSAHHYLSGHHHHVYPVHHHHHIHHHHHYTAHHWNHYDNHSHHYRNRPNRRHHHRDRDYTPQRYMRGPMSVQYGNELVEARARARRLESRLQSKGNRPVQLAQNPLDRLRTTSTPTNRVARARNISFQDDPTARIRQRESRLRQMPGDGSGSSVKFDRGRVVVDENRTRGNSSNSGDSTRYRTIGDRGNRPPQSESDTGNRPIGIGGDHDGADRKRQASGTDTSRSRRVVTLNNRSTSDADSSFLNPTRPTPNTEAQRPGTKRPTVTSDTSRTRQTPGNPIQRPTTQRPTVDPDTSRTRRTVTLNNRSATDADSSILNRTRPTANSRPESVTNMRPTNSVRPQRPTNTRPTVSANPPVRPTAPNSSSTLSNRSTRTSGPISVQPQRPSSSRPSYTTSPQPQQRPSVNTTRPSSPQVQSRPTTVRPQSQPRPNVNTSRPTAPSPQPSYSRPSNSSRPQYSAPRSTGSSSSRQIQSSPSNRSSSISSSSRSSSGSRSSGRSSSSGSSRGPR